ncbi:MAG: prepilin-type N-terminal cleavage/methylation domain-containing protein [Planctomycetaceae bacterium]|nr:prepilin-type N-terminal cleavage/methylation domain-containing protein [Planctomycetaceae bacterium]
MNRTHITQRDDSYAARRIRRAPRGLTLVELVVVLTILVALSGLIVPLVSGLGHQTNAATNATVADDVARAVRAFEGRYDKYPDNWDSLLLTTGSLHDKLNPLLTPLLAAAPPLTEAQLRSLNDVGVANVFDATAATMPTSASHTQRRALAVGGNVATLAKTTTPVDALLFNAFGIAPTPGTDYDNQFIVLGLGMSASVRGTTIADSPIVQSSDPLNYYPRMLCVFMIPPTSAAAADGFPAKFLGCLLPDGSSRTENVENYNNSRSTLN